MQRVGLFSAAVIAACVGAMITPCEAQGTPDSGVGVIAGTLSDGSAVVLVRVIGADLKPVTAALSPAQADSAARAIASGADSSWTLRLRAPLGVVVLRQARAQLLEVAVGADGREAGVQLTTDGAANLVRLLDQARAPAP